MCVYSLYNMYHHLIAGSELAAAGSNAGIEVFGLVTMGTIGARQGPPDLSVDKPSREHFPRLYIKTHIFFLQSNLICYPTQAPYFEKVFHVLFIYLFCSSIWFKIDGIPLESIVFVYIFQGREGSQLLNSISAATYI